VFQDAKIPEVFQRVAEPAEWEEFCALESVDGIDCWIISYGDSYRPPTLHERNVLRYCHLWRQFTEAVRTKLVDGDWVADGFSPKIGVRPVQIDRRLWRVLEFSLGDDVVEGHGYKFSNLFFSQARPPRAVSLRTAPPA
jgi:hypothetical protein